MKRLSWLKTKVGLFQDPRIMYMLSQPNGDTYVVLWFFLKDLAGAINDNGLVYVSAQEPMTTALIAKAMHRRKAFIEKALDVLEQLDLIQRDEMGMIQLLVWDDIQDYQKDEQRRQQTRRRVARCRAKQKEQQEKEQEPASETASATKPVMPVPPQEKTVPAETVPAHSVSDSPQAKPEPTDTTVVSHYIQRFGQVNSLMGKRLLELADDWGIEPVCKAIDIARDNGANNINYIQAVLVNSNGQPQRKENPYAKREREFDEYFDEMLRKSKELRFWENAENDDDGRNPAGNDSPAGS